MARVWIECAAFNGDAAAAMEETCLLDSVQTAVTPLGGAGGVVRVELFNSHGASFEVSRLSSDARRPVRCLTGSASRMLRTAAADVATAPGVIASTSANIFATFADDDAATTGAVLSRMQNVAAFGSVLTAAGTLGEVTSSAPGFMSSAHAIEAPARRDVAGSGGGEALSCAVTGSSISLFASNGCVVSRLAGVTHQPAGSIRIINETAHAAEAASTTDASLGNAASNKKITVGLHKLSSNYP
jgi:hypothetical protein